MHILYGVSGQGFGHATRSKEVIDHLEEKGHTVHIIGYGQSYNFLKKYFNVKKIRGPHLIYKNNQMKFTRTAAFIVKHLPGMIFDAKKVGLLVKKYKIGLIITDFEPMTAFVARKYDIPLISIDNQHQISSTKVKYPVKYKKDALLVSSITKFMIHGTISNIVTSFFYSKPKNKKTFVFPPIVRQEVLNLEPEYKDYILVYQTSAFTKLVDILKKIDAKFIVYGFDKEIKKGNVQFKKVSTDGFLNDLKDCSAVIGNAGLSLISESLYLKKPFCAFPVKRQFEQVLSGIKLEELGYGQTHTKVTIETLEEFIKNIPTYKKNLKSYRGVGNSDIFKKLDSLVAIYEKNI